MFSIVFTQATTEYLITTSGDPRDHLVLPGCGDRSIEDIFGSVPKSLYTLYKTICGGVDWEDVATPLSDVGWAAVAFFIIYVAFMFFAVLNVVVGVFCNSAIENAHRDQDAVLNEQIATKQAYIAQL